MDLDTHGTVVDEHGNRRLVISGRKCFQLVDTYGVPFGTLIDILCARKLAFNWLGFCVAAAEAGWPPDTTLSLLKYEGLVTLKYKDCPLFFWAVPLAYRYGREK